MKAGLIYWLIGCAVIGLPMGQLIRECPNADVHAMEIAATIATWPAVIFAAAFGGPINRDPQLKCRSKRESNGDRKP